MGYSSDSGGVGVYGEASSNGWGVEARSDSGYGVYAISNSNYAVYATSSASGADGIRGYVNNTWSGVAGVNDGSGAGTYGSSASGAGVVAVGSGSSGYGVYSTSNGTGVYAHGGPYGVLAYGSFYALYGSATGTSSSGVYATCSGSGCNAVYASGNIAGTGTFSYTSDERLKKDIQPLKGSLDKLLQLKGVSFYWKDPAQHGDNAGIQRGFVAQDYEKVFPEWVSTNKDGYKMITTTGLDSLEVESIRELKSQNDQLKRRLDTLEASRKVVIAGNAWGFAIGGLALGLAMTITHRKKNEAKKDE